MYGTLNNVGLQRITSITSLRKAGKTVWTVRVLDFPVPQLEAELLQPNVPVVLVLSDRVIEGRLLSFSSDLAYSIVMEC